MALMITDECINCGACEPECPNTAIYEPGEEWDFEEGTKLTNVYTLSDGTEVSVSKKFAPVNKEEVDGDGNTLVQNGDELYYIVSDKCTECVGWHEEPQCAAVCPVDCCVPDPGVPETEEELLAKMNRLHPSPA